MHYIVILLYLHIGEIREKQLLGKWIIKNNLEILKTVFIVSDLQVEENLRKEKEKIGIKVEMAEGEKCERCWMYSTTVGEDKENPTICHRCSQVIKE